MLKHARQRRGGRPLRILIADDDRDLATLFAMVLRKRGYQVFVAYDGPSGLRMARNIVPDLAILNFLMPGMTGVEVLRRLRSETRTRSIKAVVTSVAPRAAAEALAAGAEGFIQCPIRMPKLIAMVEENLGI
ncbi:MAG: response regulator [Elusimicrobiota bacterium]